MARLALARVQRNADHRRLPSRRRGRTRSARARGRNRCDARADALDRRIARIARFPDGLVDRARLDGPADHQRRSRLYRRRSGCARGSLGIAVSGDALAAIVDETLGWPIGVRLALSLVARKRGIGQTRVQTREALFALIDDEVWKPLEPSCAN